MKYGLLIGFLLHVAGAFAQQQVVVTNDFTKRVLGQELSTYNDQSGKLKLTDVLTKEFQENILARPNLGFTSGSYWVRTKLENRSDNDDFLLLINQPLLDTLEIFILNSQNKILSQYLVGQAFSKTGINVTRNFTIPFKVNKGQSRKIYLRIATKEQIVLPIYISTPSESWIMGRNSNLLFGGYFGIMLVMILYNFFIYLSIRDKSYLMYVIYVFFVAHTQAALEGFTQILYWPNNAWLASRSVYLFTTLVSTSSIVFLRDFLRTRIYAPKLHKVSNFIFIYFGILFIVALTGVSPILHISLQIGITLVGIFIFTTSIVVYRSGYTPAKFYILAWSFIVIGIITYALKDAGILPSNPITNYLLLVGTALEVVLLSIALADRINILKKEKEISQAEALQASIENAEIVKQQNVILEHKVSERTFDLESSNKKLSLTLYDLQEAQSQLVDAEKMASLGQLTAGIAHEINNPINFVIANIKPLKYDVKDILDVLELYDGIQTNSAFDEEKIKIEEFKKQVDIGYVKNEINQLLDGIQDGAYRTAEIVKGLKNFSRLDESSLKYIDLNEGLESTLVILRSTISEHIEIVKDLGELPLVECLPGKINQVFMNIANNSIQALSQKTEADNPRLIIKSWQQEDFVYFSFDDNGPGISKENKTRIFEPFFTTKPVGEGTGLGLSITFKIIEKHQGTIKVNSEEGHGTKFTIKLPIKSKLTDDSI